MKLRKLAGILMLSLCFASCGSEAQAAVANIATTTLNEQSAVIAELRSEYETQAAKGAYDIIPNIKTYSGDGYSFDMDTAIWSEIESEQYGQAFQLDQRLKTSFFSVTVSDVSGDYKIEDIGDNFLRENGIDNDDTNGVKNIDPQGEYITLAGMDAFKATSLISIGESSVPVMKSVTDVVLQGTKCYTITYRYPVYLTESDVGIDTMLNSFRLT